MLLRLAVMSGAIAFLMLMMPRYEHGRLGA
jgi:hypothetical protein